MLALKKNSKPALTLLCFILSIISIPLFAESSSSMLAIQPSNTTPVLSSTASVALTLTPTSTPTSTPTMSPPVIYYTACNALADQPAAVTRVVDSLTEDLQRGNCAVLRFGEFDNIAPVINSLPENTTIILSSEPLISPTASTPAQALAFMASSELILKNRQHLLGADEGNEDVLFITPQSFSDMHMVSVGNGLSFRNSKNETSLIRDIHFKPYKDASRDTVDSIIFAQCYNRLLRVEGNTFTLDRRASVFLDCKQSNSEVPAPASLQTTNEQMDGSIRGGPGLQFNSSVKMQQTQHSVLCCL